jgi:hypothetical protein
LPGSFAGGRGRQQLCGSVELLPLLLLVRWPAIAAGSILAIDDVN